VLTLAIVFLMFALIAGVFSLMAAGPAGPILFVVFMALFVWLLVLHRRDQSEKARKTAPRATSYHSPWKDSDRRRNR
jgi:uncharacterized membrane protein YtjA (UPF0391 family)